MFDFNQGPEEAKRQLESIRDIFQEAADKSKTKAQPLFQKLSDAFDNVINGGLSTQEFSNPFKAMEALKPMLEDLSANLQDLQKLAMSDMRVAMEFSSAMMKMQKTILKGKSAPSTGMSFPARRPKPANQPKPKGPGKGKFNF